MIALSRKSTSSRPRDGPVVLLGRDFKTLMLLSANEYLSLARCCPRLLATRSDTVLAWWCTDACKYIVLAQGTSSQPCLRQVLKS